LQVEIEEFCPIRFGGYVGDIKHYWLRTTPHQIWWIKRWYLGVYIITLSFIFFSFFIGWKYFWMETFSLILSLNLAWLGYHVYLWLGLKGMPDDMMHLSWMKMVIMSKARRVPSFNECKRFFIEWKICRVMMPFLLTCLMLTDYSVFGDSCSSKVFFVTAYYLIYSFFC
jgi:hypothetical protein